MSSMLGIFRGGFPRLRSQAFLHRSSIAAPSLLHCSSSMAKRHQSSISNSKVDSVSSVDVVVVGNGILGNSLAFVLKQHDPTLKINIVGPLGRPGAASMASGAMNGAIGEVTDSSLKNPYGRLDLELGLEATDRWPDWVQTINSKLSKDAMPLKQNFGCHVILNCAAAALDSKNFKAIEQACIEFKQPYEKVDPKDIPGINPIELHRTVDSIYLPREGWMDSRANLAAFSDIFQHTDGIDMTHGFAMRLRRGDDGLIEVDVCPNNDPDVDDGILKGTMSTVTGKKVIVALGSESSKLLKSFPELEEHKPAVPALYSGVGRAVMLHANPDRKLQSVVRTPNRSGACGLHALPLTTANGEELVYGGATNDVSFDPITKVDVVNAQFISNCLMTEIDQGLSSSLIHSWHVGNRPVTLDTHPLFGATSVDGLYVCTGTYRDGWHQSPAIAHHMAQLVLDPSYELPHHMKPFAPQRTLLSHGTKAEAIEEGVEHAIAALYEYEHFVYHAGHEELIRNSFEDSMTLIYEQLGTDYPLGPEFLWLLFFGVKRSKRPAAIAKIREGLVDGGVSVSGDPHPKEQGLTLDHVVAPPHLGAPVGDDAVDPRPHQVASVSSTTSGPSYGGRFMDTLVVEWYTSTRIGTGPEGKEVLSRFCADLIQRFGWVAVNQDVTHNESENYGLSGWVPAEDGKAIHYYCWDQMDRSFISMDLVGANSTSEMNTMNLKMKDHVQACMEEVGLGSGAPELFTWKSLQDNSQFRNLAPTIHRQRLLVQGVPTSVQGTSPSGQTFVFPHGTSSSTPTTEVEVQGQEKFDQFFHALSDALEMDLLHVASNGKSAWCHWECSGCVLTWTPDFVSVNIYTCKPFDAQHAFDVTVNLLGLARPAMQAF